MSTIQLRFEETDITRLYIPGLMQEYPTGLKITPYSLDEKKDLPSFKLSMKKEQP